MPKSNLVGTDYQGRSGFQSSAFDAEETKLQPSNKKSYMWNILNSGSLLWPKLPWIYNSNLSFTDREYGLVK